MEQQFRLISKLGTSQIENEIQNRVKGTTRRSAKLLEENSGIQMRLENNEIEEYIKKVKEA